MRRRLYFLFPDTRSVKNTLNELLLARIEIQHIHVLAKDDISLEGLPEANLFQKSDIVHGFETGIITGSATGVAAGVLATLLISSGLDVGLLILACALGGAGVGAWVSSMIGSDVVNSRLKGFQDDIEQGQILLMVDTPKDRGYFHQKPG